MHRDDLSKEFNLQTFKQLVTGLVETELYSEAKVINHNSSLIKSAQNIGHFLDNRFNNVLFITHSATVSARVKLATDTFKLMAENNIDKALVAYVSVTDEQEWRFSFISISLEEVKGKIKKSFSNPRRYSYVLGPRAKTVTPYNYLVSKDRVNTQEELQKRFSLEVVNKEFYSSIALLYTELVGGTRKKGSKIVNFPGLLKIHGKSSQSLEHQEFAVRLIGRLVFCWFLREKKSSKGTSLIPEEILSAHAAKKSMYYHSTLEPLFFELLNKKQNNRKEAFRDKSPYSLIPYLNGGLFSPQKGEGGDYYEYSEVTSGGILGIVDVPDEWLQRFTELLDTYNFTVDENTSHDVELSVDPEMLGRIFENLLAEINPETGESARKSTGSFYTPREVVEYMVDRSLSHYLQAKTGIGNEKIDALISFGIEDDLENPRSDVENRNIVEALSELKVLDPAAGSGAFPIGMLQKIVYILQQVDPNSKYWLEKQLSNVSPELRRHLETQYDNQNYDYLRKLGVIRESIFGVDIQPVATEISRLRCFLTLIVEENVEDDLKNRGIQPLPNLDFKFVTANSLMATPNEKRVGKEKKEGVSLQLFEDVSDINELARIRKNYFGANPSERLELQTEFHKLQKQMTIKSLDHYANETSKMYGALSRWEPFEHGLTDWFDPKWMFGVEDFDIVIANPPYLAEKGHSELFRKIRSDGLEKFYMGKMDLFYFFFHLAIDLASEEKGIVSFITTNYYPTASGAKKLREDFKSRTDILELVNFNELKIFESALGQHNMISILRKGKTIKNQTKTVVTSRTGVSSSEVLWSILGGEDLKTKYYSLSEEQLFDQGYIRLLSDPLVSVLNRISSNSQKLGDYCDINQGLKTNADKLTSKHISNFKIDMSPGTGIFVLDGVELEQNNILENRFIKPMYKNSDIKKYIASSVPKYFILYITNSNYITENDFAVRQHLSRFDKVLTARAEIEPEGRIKKYAITRPRNEEMYVGEKIVCSLWSRSNNFAYSNGDWYAATDVTFITSKNVSLNLLYILGILNSKLAYAWFKYKGKSKGNLLEFPPRPISEFPIVMNSKLENEITSIVKEIIATKNLNHKADTDALESKVDELVYRAYCLDEDEIKLIESLKNE